MKRVLLAAITLLACIVPAWTDSAPREIFRLRVENSPAGRVQVSVDAGKTFTTVGHVNQPAVRAIKGFAASAYTPDRAVAATAVHSIRIKTGTVNGDPMSVSIVSSEFAQIPDGYGGFVPYDSGIYTDIPTGTAIFRNFAPFVGSPTRLERSGKLLDIPYNWQPKKGDVLVTIAYLPKPYLREVEFENKKGGQVTATYDDGTKQAIAIVKWPVSGIGRYDATSYTGEGLINTNHGGVITVSTAPITDSDQPEGRGDERRGGFQIEPYEHWKTQPEMPQTMVVAPLPGATAMEGRPPLFCGHIGLSFDPKSPSNSMRTEVAYADGSWHPFPAAMGKSDDALKRLGVTKIRLLFPAYDPAFLSKDLLAAAARPKGPSVKGMARLEPSKGILPGYLVSFVVDGSVRSVTNQPPYRFLWNTETVPNGEHQVEIRISDSAGTVVSSEIKNLVVWNPG